MEKNCLIKFEQDVIAKLLREHRSLNKLSIDDVVSCLSEMCIEISPKTLYGYENNVGTPKVRTFLALCEIYKIKDVMSAFSITSINSNAIISNFGFIDGLTLMENEHIKKYRSLSPEGRGRVDNALNYEHKQKEAAEAKTPANSA